MGKLTCTFARSTGVKTCVKSACLTDHAAFCCLTCRKKDLCRDRCPYIMQRLDEMAERRKKSEKHR